jgi:hypothetical protein
MPKTGATPGKLALIAGLVVVLAWVLFSPAESEVAEVAEETAKLATDAPRRRPRPRPVPAPVQKPAFPLVEVLRFDPFAPLAAVVPEANTDIASVGNMARGIDGDGGLTGDGDATTNGGPTGEAAGPPPDRLAGWRTLRVEAIIDTVRGKAALVGDRTVREGEVIDGVRVVKIASDGVLVEDCAAEHLAD